MNHSNLAYKKVAHAELLLKVSYGLLFIVAGADKFLHYIVNWNQYVNPAIFHLLGLDYSALRIFIAAVEIILGILVLTKWTRIGAYGIAVWFLIIAVNLIAMWGYLDIAARDVVLAMGAIALAWLTESQNK